MGNQAAPIEATEDPVDEARPSRSVLDRQARPGNGMAIRGREIAVAPVMMFVRTVVHGPGGWHDIGY
jgi:hypothetical protein